MEEKKSPVDMLITEAVGLVSDARHALKKHDAAERYVDVINATARLVEASSLQHKPMQRKIEPLMDPNKMVAGMRSIMEQIESSNEFITKHGQVRPKDAL